MRHKLYTYYQLRAKWDAQQAISRIKHYFQKAFASRRPLGPQRSTRWCSGGPAGGRPRLDEEFSGVCQTTFAMGQKTYLFFTPRRASGRTTRTRWRSTAVSRNGGRPGALRGKPGPPSGYAQLTRVVCALKRSGGGGPTVVDTTLSS
jgi:hypothetical protein